MFLIVHVYSDNDSEIGIISKNHFFLNDYFYVQHVFLAMRGLNDMHSVFYTNNDQFICDNKLYWFISFDSLPFANC